MTWRRLSRLNIYLVEESKELSASLTCVAKLNSINHDYRLTENAKKYHNYVLSSITRKHRNCIQNHTTAIFYLQYWMSKVIKLCNQHWTWNFLCHIKVWIFFRFSVFSHASDIPCFYSCQNKLFTCYYPIAWAISHTALSCQWYVGFGLSAASSFVSCLRSESCRTLSLQHTVRSQHYRQLIKKNISMGMVHVRHTSNATKWQPSAPK